MRRGYLDWLRGLAVLIMIEAHVIDSWTRLDDRGSSAYEWSMILGGFGAPLFLFLAGLSVALSAGAKMRHGMERRDASGAVVTRGLEIFGLAFLFRLQAMVVSWGPWRSLLKVDILNIMGPAIMAAAALWGGMKTTRGRLMAFAVATLALAFLTPPVRAASILAALPDPIEGYLRPRPGFTNFAIFPWAGFVFGGAFLGVLLDEARNPSTERRLNTWFAVGGGLLAVGAFAASHVPSLFANSEFWTSSPSFFLLRTGILVLTVPVAYLWHRRPRGEAAFSPLQQMGRTSLFIYWIHIELIYGLIVRPLHKSLTFGQACLGVVIFAVLMLLVSLVKDRLVEVWRRSTIAGSRQRAPKGAV